MRTRGGAIDPFGSSVHLCLILFDLILGAVGIRTPFVDFHKLALFSFGEGSAKIDHLLAVFHVKVLELL